MRGEGRGGEEGGGKAGRADRERGGQMGIFIHQELWGVPRGSLPWPGYKIFTQYISASGLHLCREEFEGEGKQ